jgi:hypothetical protein
MNYSVTWVASAEARLTEIWLAAEDQQAIANAADEIDRSLRRSPNDVGESRPDQKRILASKPLSIIFAASDSDRRVAVLEVWRPK